MKSPHPYTEAIQEQEEEYYPMDRKQQPPASSSSIGANGVGSSTDEKSLPLMPPPMPPRLPPRLPPPPPAFPVYAVAPAGEVVPEMLPLGRSNNNPLRRRRCLLGWLCVAPIVVVAAILVFVVYGIPASHCCSCLIAYDKCNDGVATNNTTTQQLCLDRFYTCSASTNYVFFNCNNRLYDRHMSCAIQYFND